MANMGKTRKLTASQLMCNETFRAAQAISRECSAQRRTYRMNRFHDHLPEIDCARLFSIGRETGDAGDGWPSRSGGRRQQCFDQCRRRLAQVECDAAFIRLQGFEVAQLAVEQ